MLTLISAPVHTGGDGEREGAGARGGQEEAARKDADRRRRRHGGDAVADRGCDGGRWGMGTGIGDLG